MTVARKPTASATAPREQGTQRNSGEQTHEVDRRAHDRDGPRRRAPGSRCSARRRPARTRGPSQTGRRGRSRRSGARRAAPRRPRTRPNPTSAIRGTPDAVTIRQRHERADQGARAERATSKPYCGLPDIEHVMRERRRQLHERRAEEREHRDGEHREHERAPLTDVAQSQRGSAAGTAAFGQQRERSTRDGSRAAPRRRAGTRPHCRRTPLLGRALRGRSRPAPGPKARAAVNCIEFRRIALTMSSGGTSWGTNDCHAAMLIPDRGAGDAEDHDDVPRRRDAAAPRTPRARTPASIMIELGHKHDRLRGKRSASDPASGPTNSAGPNAMNAVKPTHVVECVIWKITYGTVIVCIQVPEFEISAEIQKTVVVARPKRRVRRCLPSGSVCAVAFGHPVKPSSMRTTSPPPAGSGCHDASCHHVAANASRTLSGVIGRSQRCPSLTATVTRPA